MIPAMTDRGLPIVDGAPACPFVAFEDDRDGRALAPDHRHRCFAEPRPAPRALAHQGAYCLASAFAVCPTFQDWARREAAAARPGTADPRPVREDIPVVTPVSTPLPPLVREPRHASGTETPPPIPPRRNPQREWAAPPPWSGEDQPPNRSTAGSPYGPAAAGLAGSAAYRLAGPDPEQPATPRPSSSYAPPVDDLDDAWPDDVDDERDGPDPAVVDGARYAPGVDTPPATSGSTPAARAGTAAAAGATSKAGATSGSSDQVHRPPTQDPSEVFGPAWERPKRYEAYPSLKTRVGLPSMGGIPRLGVAVIVLVLAAFALFFLGPMLLGIGGKDSGTGPTKATPGPTAAEVTPTPAITAVPAPTAHVYIVAKGDTMSKIAKKFGVTVAQLQTANPKIKDPNKIKIGDPVNIPVPVPDAGAVTAAP
jgi:LysM repeat protein